MKNMNELKAFSLNKKQMNRIDGGSAVQQSEYCEHLQQMTRGEEAQDWTQEEWDAWAEMWDTYCMR